MIEETITGFCRFCEEDVPMIATDRTDMIFVEHVDLVNGFCPASRHTVAEMKLMFADAANEAFANKDGSKTRPDDPIFST